MPGPATPAPIPETEGRRRVVIEGVDPEIDGGEFPAKAVQGDPFQVEVDAFADGHDRIRCVLLYRMERQRRWREVDMEPLGNDRWQGTFVPDELGRFVYTVEGWIDRFGTWRSDLDKRIRAGQNVAVDLEIGAGIIARVARQAKGVDARRMRGLAEEMKALAGVLAAAGVPPRIDDASARGSKPWGDAPAPDENPYGASRNADPYAGSAAKSGAAAAAPTPAASSNVDLAALLTELDGELGALIRASDPRAFATRYPKQLEVVVDRPRAAFSAWYEFFPRSTGTDGKHGTFADAERMLTYVHDLGFDVVYLPPIHPIGRTKRKGKNNRPEGEEGDVGSPWGIGAEEGGHEAVHPDLGTMKDFRSFRAHAESMGIEVALDIAFQASPDHPWVKKHPEWFRHRPDGSIQYAENPPKKYEDIYPLNFESDDWKGLWKALYGVFDHWASEGVRIFRVDNPHTKSFPFWAWCIPALKRRWPDLIFLSEAFTRPRPKYHLAKLGFTQSYTYFTWRNYSWDLREYMTELTRTQLRHFVRPNFWPNTPDILHESLQTGGRPAFMTRLVLAATLSSSYGIYGPAYELLEHHPREHGSEEYLSSEKYQLRAWDLKAPDSLRHFIRRVNRIRRDNAALQRTPGIVFHQTTNDMLLAYSKVRGDNRILCLVNLDPRNTQSGWVDLRMDELGLGWHDTFTVHDLLSDARYTWSGQRNYVELNPHVVPAHVFKIQSTLQQPTPNR